MVPKDIQKILAILAQYLQTDGRHVFLFSSFNTRTNRNYTRNNKMKSCFFMQRKGLKIDHPSTVLQVQST
jgi:hypothetical protein